MRKSLILLFLALCFPLVASARDGDTTAFRPHWFIGVQGGLGLHTGEATVGRLLSPAAQLSVGYCGSPLWSARLAVSGWQARNRACRTGSAYEWRYVQPTLDVAFSLVDAVGCRRAGRRWDCRLFVGGGVNVAFDNDDARRLAARGDAAFEKLWRGTRVAPVVRGGIDVRWRVARRIALTVEANTNILDDKFNSKRGRHDNLDNQSHLLAGVQICVGRSRGRRGLLSERSPRPEASLPPEAEVASLPAAVPILSGDTTTASAPSEISAPRRPAPSADRGDSVTAPSRWPHIYIFFDKGRADLREDERPKLIELLTRVWQNPAATVRLLGYADRETGTEAANMRLSEQRVMAIRTWLIGHSIQPSRIVVGAFGDTEQPFDLTESNRVVICIVNP